MSIAINVYYDTVVSVNGNVSLDRTKFFCTNICQTNVNIQTTLNQNCNFFPGRYLCKFSSMNPPEDPTNPGFADPSFFSNATQYATEMENNKINIPSHDAITLCTSFCPDYMEIPNTDVFSSGIAQANMNLLFMQNISNFAYLPKYLEGWNEPDSDPYWETFSSNPIPWLNFCDYTNTLSQRIKSEFNSILISGPTFCFPHWHLNDFSKWQTMRTYLNKCFMSLDRIALHCYRMSPARYDAILDLPTNYYLSNYKKNVRYLISEYGSAPNIDPDVITPVNYWGILYGTCALTITALNRRQQIDKAIAFIVPQAPWAPESIWALFDNRGNITPMMNFVNFWSSLPNLEINFIVTENANLSIIRSVAFINKNIVYLILCNRSSTEQNISVNVYPQASESATITRLYWDGTNPNLSTDTLSDNNFTVSPNEISLITYTVNPVINISVMNETLNFANKIMIPIETSSISLPISGIANPSYAILRFTLYRPLNMTVQPLSILFNNLLLPDLSAPIEGFEQNQGFYGSFEIVINQSCVNAENNIVFTFTSSGGYLCTVALILQTPLVS